MCSSDLITIANGKAHRPIEEASDEKIEHVLQHNVDRIFGADSPSFQKGKTLLHDQHRCTHEQVKEGVDAKFHVLQILVLSDQRVKKGGHVGIFR